MDRQTRSCVYLYLVFFILVVITTIIEYPQTQIDLQFYFILAKLFTLICTLQAIIYFSIKKKYSFFPHFFVFFGFCTYSALGEIFRPTYEYALTPIFVIGMMLAPLSLRLMLIFVGIGTALFCWVYFIFYERNLVLIQSMNVYDNMYTFVTFGLTSGFTAYFLNFERQQKLDAQARYSLIGAQATSIIHDLKNLLSSPRILIDNLNQLLVNQKTPEIVAAISEIEITLKHASESSLRFNQMAVLSNTDRTKILIKEIVTEVQFMLHQRLKDVEVAVQGDSEIIADRGFLTSLFLNLFMNSLSAFSQTANKKISITIDNEHIVFQDNGIGFSMDVLKALNAGLSMTTKKDGTGLGLLIIREACRDLGAKVRIYNSEVGACIEIRF